MADAEISALRLKSLTIDWNFQEAGVSTTSETTRQQMAVLQFTAEWDVNPADHAVGRIGSTAKIWTSGSSDPTDAAISTERAHFRTGRLTSKPAGSTTRARSEHNERTNGKRGVGRSEWTYTRVARDGVTNGAQVVHGRTKAMEVVVQHGFLQRFGLRPLLDQESGRAIQTTCVDKATEINDPIDNVAQGMENIGQAFVTAPDTYVVPANGTTGHMALIPGVGSTDVAEEKKRNDEDEETKASDPVDENNASDEPDEGGADDAPSETQEAPASTNDDGAAMAPLTALTAALRQMVTTMARMDARLDQLSTTATNPAQSQAPTDSGTQVATTQQPPAPVTNPPASTSTAQAPAAPQQDQPAATHRQFGGDSSDDDDSSSSSSDDDSDGNDRGGRRGRRQPATRPGDDDFHHNRRRTIRDLDLPTFLPTPQE
ncbi:hypothetical protein PHYSODRAFT_331403 [Phytophthora sojae]|uniref:Uncharacterized protein n=1 Tax=Phytophthora sojae (strain P6497) TaxID=1094619 RepID=G4ZE77_PHYSP|nr:hypothetical protein PHYSODRAFT_331403 [Phytophthora sojae]EGZ17428.1 hypothetical protein PHYSODRAFT_331403 [Phytophthora sojae]|eukprot:XP_009526486.1 hypothetical protein PHYSODRAFT_331403 [Phytophthora sojae]